MLDVLFLLWNAKASVQNQRFMLLIKHRTDQEIATEEHKSRKVDKNLRQEIYFFTSVNNDLIGVLDLYWSYVRLKDGYHAKRDRLKGLYRHVKLKKNKQSILINETNIYKLKCHQLILLRHDQN